jgi:hypothetical protein
MAGQQASGAAAPPQQPPSNAGAVQCAFSLGWHMVELYNYPDLKRSVSKKTPASLGGISDLSDDERRDLLIRQIEFDLSQLWTLPGAAPPPLNYLQTALKRAPGKNFKADVDRVHKDLLQGLTVADFKVGKGYGLGRALAETWLLPKGAGGSAKGYWKALSAELDVGRVATVQSWIRDLRDCFPKHAADAVAQTFEGWAFWLIRPTVDGKPIDLDDRQAMARLERQLQRQAEIWRGLLSGEKDPANMLTTADYVTALRTMLGRSARLASGSW